MTILERVLIVLFVIVAIIVFVSMGNVGKFEYKTLISYNQPATVTNAGDTGVKTVTNANHMNTSTLIMTPPPEVVEDVV